MSRFGVVLQAACVPVIKVLLIAFIGAFCARKNGKILKDSSVMGISKLIYNIFLPAFIFTKLTKTVDVQIISQWWPIPVFVALNFAAGLVCGLALLKLFPQKSDKFKGLVLASCALGNVGQIPLALVPSACSSQIPKYAIHGANCVADAQAMVAFGLWIGTIMIWTVGKYLMTESFLSKNQPKEYAEFDTENGSSSVKDLEVSLQVRIPQKVNKHMRRVSLAKEFLARIPNPPFAATVLGLLCGGVGFLKFWLTNPDSFLAPGFDVLEQLGSTYIPLMILLLGANMNAGTADKEDDIEVLHPFMVASIIAVRLLVLPLVGVGLVYSFKQTLAPNLDPLIEFVILLQFSVPTAANLSTLAIMTGTWPTSVSRIALSQYLVAVPCLTIAIMAYITYSI
mmetsp:Transcript_13291/g.30592  ORF Transcript_13291/g.30592 Transcript_13291/m.30592 type:complete len:396 (-) Transcript_13291:184-1371(-)|eukprot:768273-Hanusia_phi.AAC.3